MSYVIVTAKDTIVTDPFASYDAAFREATRLYGDDIHDWLALNLRIEEWR